MACVPLAGRRIELTLEWPVALPVTRGLAVTITDRVDAVLVDGVIVCGFRPESFRFANARDWTIEEFKIGNYSQLRRGNVRASNFHDALNKGGCQTIQLHDDVSMIIRPARSNLRFRCRMTGSWA